MQPCKARYALTMIRNIRMNNTNLTTEFSTKVADAIANNPNSVISEKIERELVTENIIKYAHCELKDNGCNFWS